MHHLYIQLFLVFCIDEYNSDLASRTTKKLQENRSYKFLEKNSIFLQMNNCGMSVDFFIQNWRNAINLRSIFEKL